MRGWLLQTMPDKELLLNLQATSTEQPHKGAILAIILKRSIT